MDMIVESDVGPTYVPGNLVWLQVVEVDGKRNTRDHYRGILVHKWLLAAQYLIIEQTGLHLSWPTIIEFEQDGKWAVELKSEVLGGQT